MNTNELYEDISVTFKDSMGDDLAVADAARVSFAKESDWDYFDYITWDTTKTNPLWKYDRHGHIDHDFKRLKKGDANLIRYLSLHNHWTPFGHVQIKVHVKAPIFIARQAQKHQVGLVWNEVSRRYVSTPPTFHIPTNWRKAADNKKQGSSDEIITSILIDDEPVTPENLYSEIVDHSFATYDKLIKGKVAPEQARAVLLQSTNTEWIWTGSLSAFARIWDLRSEATAQKENQILADLISNEISHVAPISWHYLTRKREILYLQQRLDFMNEFSIFGEPYEKTLLRFNELYNLIPS